MASNSEVQTLISGRIASIVGRTLMFAQHTDDRIEQEAETAGERIRPLLSVYRNWIEAAMDEVRRGHSDDRAAMAAFLGNDLVPSMTGDQVVDRLRQLYLH
jgi:hypothetical protein